MRVCKTGTQLAHHELESVLLLLMLMLFGAGPGHQDVEGGQSLPEEQRIAFWNDVNVPRNIKERLSGALTDVYIQLDNLSKFVELNYDGFR